MTIKLYKTEPMKKLLWLLLLFAGMVNAQPTINNPSPYQVCDNNTNGFAAFDFNVITPIIITQSGTLVSYHLTLANSQAAIDPIDLATPYTNTIPFNQTIYIRAWDIADPSLPAFSTLSLVVSEKPSAFISSTTNCVGIPMLVTTTVTAPGSYSYAYVLPFGAANPGDVANFSTTVEGSYFVTVTDLVSGCVSNQAGVYVAPTPSPVVTISATSVCDGNPAIVSTSVNSGNGLLYNWTVPAGATNPGSVPNFSTSIEGTYDVIVTDTGTGCISNPVSVIVITQTTVIPSFSIPATVCFGNPLPTTSDDGFTGTWSPAVETTGTYIFTPAIGQCATTYSTIITVAAGVNVNQAPNLVENSVTNTASFDLTSQNAIISSAAGVQFEYYPSLLEAENSSNAITNPSNYINTSNPQTIGVRVFDPIASECAAITSFDLVVNNPNNVFFPDINLKSRLLALGFDTNVDGEIQFTEASVNINEIDVSFSAISDLTGIEAFTNVQILRCNNNNLTNLNINNLTTLTHLFCSTNQITNLNLSNLVNLKFLDCASNVLTNLDVTPLNQLEDLNCALNQLTAINVDPLINLKKLICSNNSINSLSLNNLPNLERLEYQYNQSTSLTFSNVPALKYLDCSVNFGISSLDLSAVPLLEYLDCRYNSLTSVNVSSLSNLIYLDCSVNQLPSVNLAGLNSLTTFYAYNNFITTIDITNLPSLTSVIVDFNQMTSLNLTGSNNLNNLSCRYNQLTSLDLTGLVNLNSFNSSYNQLTALNFEGLTSLYTVLCDYNLLTSLDFSTATSLQVLSCSNNNLSTINIKNGNSNIDTNSFYSWSQNPILTFVCADEAKVAAIGQFLNQSTNANNGNVVFNSYCSFVPGGFYNGITGQIKLDANNNGCDTNDLPKQFIKVSINGTGNQGATFTDANGNYKFYTAAGSFDVTPEVENPTWFGFSPASATILFSNVNDNSTQDFCMVPNGVHQDVEVVIQPIDAAQPGTNATYRIVYRNKGNQVVSGSLSMNYNDASLDFTSATIAPSSQTEGVLGWNYTGLLPFESRSFIVTLYVNSPSSTPPVNIGSILNFSASINPIATDENQADNQFTFDQAVVGTYVPNGITCLQGDLVSTVEIGNYLHYVVNFENTGNYLAQNVIVRIEIDTARLDIATLQLLSSSHSCYARIVGNIVEFIFEGINLEARSGIPPVGGHGDVLFKIRTNNNLVNNDIVLQRAGLYFDYNFPITTNTAETVFATLSNAGFELDASIAIYPNPTNAIININADSNIKSMELYDMQGRILQTMLGNQKVLDISDKANGIYFLKITTEKGSKVEKIIKE
jgi:Leucine-rich repeat (LRR) protein